MRNSIFIFYEPGIFLIMSVFRKCCCPEWTYQTVFVHSVVSAFFLNHVFKNLKKNPDKTLLVVTRTVSYVHTGQQHFLKTLIIQEMLGS